MTQLDLFPEELPDEQGSLPSAIPPARPVPGTPSSAAVKAPTLAAVGIERLKGFKQIEVKLSNLAILTGPNNSGKSTLLQGIALGYECLRRCVDTSKWAFSKSGRITNELEFLPVNQPKDLWYQRATRGKDNKDLPVRIRLDFTDGRKLTFRVRFLYGQLNLSLETSDGVFDAETIQALLRSMPVLIPATPGPVGHEAFQTQASVHRTLLIREPNRVIRNVLHRIQEDSNQTARAFVDDVLNRYLGVKLDDIDFDEMQDTEMRAPVASTGFSLDIVSNGSGFNQILQMAAIIAWRNPSLVLLDEPDAHLHSSVQAQLFSFLRDMVDRYGVQVVLCTHSRDLISQAPLDCIIPVDPQRPKLRPLTSLEHLLLEYKRYGELQNVDLALLYQSKRCLFVEGKSDVDMLPRLAHQLGAGTFGGISQVVCFPFGGVDNIKLLPPLIALFERLVGTNISWAVLRDADALVPEVQKKVQDAGDALGGAMFRIWDRYSIENYLLEPSIIMSCLNEKKQDHGLSSNDVETLLIAIADAMQDAVMAQYVTRAQTSYRDLKLADRWQEEGAAAASRYWRQLSPEAKVLRSPGKTLFGQLVQRLQEKCGVTLRLDDLINHLSSGNAPASLAAFMGDLQKAFPKPQPLASAAVAGNVADVTVAAAELPAADGRGETRPGPTEESPART